MGEVCPKCTLRWSAVLAAVLVMGFLLPFTAFAQAPSIGLPPAQLGGGSYDIVWTAPSDNTVTLEYSTDGKATWSAIGAPNLPVSDGQVSWTVPTGDFTDCYVRISGDVSGAGDEVGPFTIDSTAPTFASDPVADPASWTNADTVTITWEGDDVPSTDGLTAEYRLDSANDADYSVDVSPLALDVSALPDGKHTVDVRLTDAVGQMATKSVDFFLDNAAPTVALSDNHADSIVRDADTVIITATFADDNGIDEGIAPTITIANGGVAAAAMTKVSNLVWTYTWDVPATGAANAAVSISATDVAGNASAAATGKTAYTIDNAASSVSVSDDHPDSVVRDADTVVITATFTDANGIDEATPPTITIANGGVAGAAMTKVSNLVWTYTWNVPATGAASATVSISAINVAGSPSAAATGKTSYTIDNIAPTVVLSDDHADSIVRDVDTVVITATFTEAEVVNETTPPTITIANGGVAGAAMTKVSNLVWTYTWDVPATAAANATVSISATDLAGNANAAATGKTAYTIDNAASSVSLSDDHPDSVVRDADTVVITATFTDANGIDEATPPTITIANGGVAGAAMTKVSNLVWTYNWDVPATGAASATVSISAINVAGSASAAATGKTSYTIDNTAPTVVLSDDHADSIVRDADTVVITATFSEANGIDEATPPTITIANGGVAGAAMTKVSNLVWTYTWDVPSTASASATVSISALDVAGIANAAVTGKTSYSIENIAPTVVVSDDHADSIVRDADTVVITATFTEADGIDEATPPTITIANGGVAAAAMTKTSNLVWTYTWNVPATGAASATVSISATDVAGNSSDAATGKTSYTIDNIAPTVALTDDHDDAIVRDDDTVIITATFAEDNGLDETTPPTITIANGGVTGAAMIKVSNLVWTYTWSVPSTASASATVSISATDVAGNANAAATGETSYTVDNEPPTVSIGAPSASLTSGGPIDYSVTFSKPVTGFDSGGITLNTTNTAHGLVNVSSAGNGTDYTVTISGITGDGTLGITVNAGAAQDVAGDGNTVSSASGTFTVDNTAPAVSIQVEVSKNGGAFAAIDEPIVWEHRTGYTYRIHYTATDANGISTYAVRCIDSVTATTQTITSGSGNPEDEYITLDPATLLDSDNCSFSVTATDNVGNLNSAVATNATTNAVFGVYDLNDLRAPTVKIVTPPTNGCVFMFNMKVTVKVQVSMNVFHVPGQPLVAYKADNSLYWLAPASRTSVPLLNEYNVTDTKTKIPKTLHAALVLGRVPAGSAAPAWKWNNKNATAPNAIGLVDRAIAYEWTQDVTLVRGKADPKHPDWLVVDAKYAYQVEVPYTSLKNIAEQAQANKLVVPPSTEKLGATYLQQREFARFWMLAK